jgi:hypothetical protein
MASHGSGILAARWLAAVAVAEAAMAGGCWFSDAFPFGPKLAYAIGFAVVAATTIMVACACPRLSPRALILLLMPGAALWAIATHGGTGLGAAMAVTAALLLAGTLVGSVVGGAIEHPGQLLFVALVSGAADLASVLHPGGPSAALAQAPAALSLLALPWPMLGSGAIEPFLGVGDIVFAAIYTASSRRHALAMGRTVLALSAAFLVTMALVLWWERPVPVLPLLGLGMIVAHPQARRPAQRDRTRGWLLATLVIAAVMASLLRA